MKRLLALLIPLLLISCGTERLTVQSEYLLPGRYASVWVNTPDPHKRYPDVGQRLIIQWKLKQEFACYENLTLRLRIRFRNYETLEKEYPIRCQVGRLIYRVMNEDYRCTQGVGAYTVEIVGDGQQIAKIQHHLWKELIVIDGDEGEEFDEFEDPEDFPEEFDYEPEFDEGEGFWRV